jgi:hypothetical protein
MTGFSRDCPLRRLWSAVTCHRFGQSADESAHSKEVEQRMKKKATLFLVVTLLLVNAVYPQEPTGPRPKRARTPADYQAGTLKDLTAKLFGPDSRGNKLETMRVDPDLSPTRVTVTYAGLTRRLTESKAEVVRQWSRLYAGSLDTYKPYQVEVLFNEDGSKYWLTFTHKTLDAFWSSNTWNKPVDLFLIRMGAVKAGDNWEPVFLVESYQAK